MQENSGAFAETVGLTQMLRYGYFRRNRNSVPIAAMAWLSRTWIARAKTIDSSI